MNVGLQLVRPVAKFHDAVRPVQSLSPISALVGAFEIARFKQPAAFGEHDPGFFLIALMLDLVNLLDELVGCVFK